MFTVAPAIEWTALRQHDAAIGVCRSPAKYNSAGTVNSCTYAEIMGAASKLEYRSRRYIKVASLGTAARETERAGLNLNRAGVYPICANWNRELRFFFGNVQLFAGKLD